MARSSINISGDYRETMKQIQRLQQASETAIKRTIGDVKTRVPTWIAAEVSKQYGIKKSDITNQRVGAVEVKGNSIDTIEIKYKGRPLTPTHFGMSPSVPKPSGSYTLKATVIRGQRKTLGKVKKLTKKQRAEIGKNFQHRGSQSSSHSPIMLLPTGNRREGGVDYIPFQRKSKDRNNIEAIKTVSLPQMVSGEKASPNINRTIDEKLQERLNRHLRLLER